MIHNLSKMFMDYGDSNWTIGILIGLFVIIIGVILWLIGLVKEFYNQESLTISISGMITIVIGVLIIILPVIGCAHDKEQNIQTAIRKEYEDASFDKLDDKFISDNITYSYDVKNRKIIVYPLIDNANIKIIE